jgi:VanZ family protein
MARWPGIACWLTLILFNSSISASPAPVPSFVSFLVAKAGHVVEYTLLGWMLARALVAPAGGFGLQPQSAWAVTVSFGLCFAILDEIRQYFVQSRVGQGGDVVLDGLSLVAGASLGLWRVRWLAGELGRRAPAPDSDQPAQQGTGKDQHQELHRQDLPIAVAVGQERHHHHEVDQDEQVQQDRPRRPAPR